MGLPSLRLVASQNVKSLVWFSLEFCSASPHDRGNIISEWDKLFFSGTAFLLEGSLFPSPPALSQHHAASKFSHVLVRLFLSEHK